MLNRSIDEGAEMRALVLFACLGCAALGHAAATQESPAPDVNETLIQRCEELSGQTSDELSEIAETLKGRRTLLISADLGRRGAKCLTDFFGESYSYSGRAGRFLSERVEAEQKDRAEKLQREQREKERAGFWARVERRAAEQAESAERLRIHEEAERAQAERDREYASGLVDACYDMLEDDRFKALTNLACAQVFKTLGLERP